MINGGSALTPGAIDAYCAEHGMKLPDALRRQLQEQNGGAPRTDYYVSLPDGDVTELYSFFGLGMPDTSSELAWVAETAEGRVPQGMLPFADDPGGNLYLLDEVGSVWFWDHELEGRSEALVRLSDSLDDFLNALATDLS
jgi:SMI1/KNR4 family protein SUKH-1